MKSILYTATTILVVAGLLAYFIADAAHKKNSELSELLPIYKDITNNLGFSQKNFPNVIMVKKVYKNGREEIVYKKIGIEIRSTYRRITGKTTASYDFLGSKYIAMGFTFEHPEYHLMILQEISGQ